MTGTISLTPFKFPEHTRPLGRLSRNYRAQACWYFYVMAQKIREKVGDSTEDQFGLLDGELWMDKNYVQLARTIALLYNLESPDEFAKAWEEVRAEASRCNLPDPHPEYTRLAPRQIIM